MKVLIGVQARSTSDRLKRKSLRELWGKPLYLHPYLEAVEAAESVDKKRVQVTVAVLVPPGDGEMKQSLWDHKARFFEDRDGHEDDVVGRYRNAMDYYAAEYIIRITGDCPAIPKEIIQAGLGGLLYKDYASNTIDRTYPEGFDIQGCSKEAFEWIAKIERRKEHPFADFDANAIIRERFIEDGFSYGQIINNKCMSMKHLSVDTLSHLKTLQKFKTKKALWRTL